MGVLKSIFKNRYLLSEERLSQHCRKCDNFVETTSQCRLCGCFMDYKTMLYDASCPDGRWGPYEEQKEEN